MQCPSCGAALEHNAVTCEHCGARLTERSKSTSKVRRIATERRPPAPLTMPVTHPVPAANLPPPLPPSADDPAALSAAETREWPLGISPPAPLASPLIGKVLEQRYRVSVLLGSIADDAVYGVEDLHLKQLCWSCGVAITPASDEHFCEECGAERRPYLLYLRTLTPQTAAATFAAAEAAPILMDDNHYYLLLANAPAEIVPVPTTDPMPPAFRTAPTVEMPAPTGQDAPLTLLSPTASASAATVFLPEDEGATAALPIENGSTAPNETDESAPATASDGALPSASSIDIQATVEMDSTGLVNPTKQTALANGIPAELWAQNNAPTLEASALGGSHGGGIPRLHVTLRTGFASDVGRSRIGKPNEDSALVTTLGYAGDSVPPPLTLCIVADGLGGHDEGQRAGRVAIRTIAQHIIQHHWTPSLNGLQSTLYDPFALGEILRMAIQEANTQIININMTEGCDMGCTVTALIAQGQAACIANVGDSRTYRFDGATLHQITIDHSLVARLVKANMIEPHEVYTHPQRSQIYRSLGDELEVQVDLFPHQLAPGEVFVLCSDGLWEMVRDPDIATIVDQSIERDPQLLAEQLIHTANAHGGDDNVTVVVAQVVV